MTVDTIISSLKTQLATISGVRNVYMGLDLPDDAGVSQYPAIFIYGGSYTFTQGAQKGTFREEGTFSLYIYVYDANHDTGLSTLNTIRDGIIDKLSANQSFYLTGPMEEDRDTTFKNIGEPYNAMPPFFVSRFDVTFNVPVTNRR